MFLCRKRKPRLPFLSMTNTQINIARKCFLCLKKKYIYMFMPQQIPFHLTFMSICMHRTAISQQYKRNKPPSSTNIHNSYKRK